MKVLRNIALFIFLNIFPTIVTITFKITSCKFNINTESVGKLVLVTLEFYVQLNVCPEELTEVYSETKRSKT